MGEPNLTDLEQVARLIHERNEIDAQVNAIVRRSPVHGHLGEYIAAAIFDINLNRSASHAGHDGSFASGVLEGKTVNIKWYGRREGILDMKEENAPDFYLVMTGPRGPGVRGGLRPLVIDAVYLFETQRSSMSRGGAMRRSVLRRAYRSTCGMRPRSTRRTGRCTASCRTKGRRRCASSRPRSSKRTSLPGRQNSVPPSPLTAPRPTGSAARAAPA